jgi:hypothetical protein
MKALQIYKFCLSFIICLISSTQTHAYSTTLIGTIDFSAYDNQWDLIPDWPGYLPPDSGKAQVKASVSIDTQAKFTESSSQEIAAGTTLTKNRSFYETQLGMTWSSALGQYIAHADMVLEYTTFRITQTLFDPVKNKLITINSDWSGVLNTYTVDEWDSEVLPETLTSCCFNLDSPYSEATGHTGGQLLENQFRGGSMNGQYEAGDIDFLLDNKIFKNKKNPPKIEDLFSKAKNLDIILDLYAGCFECTQGTYIAGKATFSRVPEPSTIAITTLGLLALSQLQRKKRH